MTAMSKITNGWRRGTGSRCVAEGGGWLVRWWPGPHLDGRPATELLAAADRLRGNLRYARLAGSSDRGIVLLGEVRGPVDGLTLAEALARLPRPLDPAP